MRLNLGYRDLPDTLLPKAQAVFGGTTPAETQANIQAFVWWQLREWFLGRRGELLEGGFQAQRNASRSEDEADFPSG